MGAFPARMTPTSTTNHVAELRRHPGMADARHPLRVDAKLGFDLGVRHHGAWVRSAIVTYLDWMARPTRLFAWMIPGEARIFETAALEPSTQWVAGDRS